jgi:hypothetical protein
MHRQIQVNMPVAKLRKTRERDGDNREPMFMEAGA